MLKRADLMALPPRQDNRIIEDLGLLGVLKEDLATHYGDWSLPGFRAVAVYRFGVWARTLNNGLLRASFALIHRSMFRFVRNVYGIELSHTARIGRRFHIGHQGAIVIHAHATIGDDCLVRQGVTLGVGGLARDVDFRDTGPVVGNRVDFGAGCMVVGRVTIGDNVNIGPNAVVMVDVPANATVLPQLARVMARPAPKAEAPEASAEPTNPAAPGGGDAGSIEPSETASA